MDKLRNNQLLQILVGIAGISIVILIHEFGHFLFCKFFGVSTSVFSIGLGPRLTGIMIGSTDFRISLIPLGGYVAMDASHLKIVSYIAVLLIFSAGILFNIVTGYLALTYVRSKNRESLAESTSHLTNFFASHQGFVGPLALIKLIGSSTLLGFSYFLCIFALLSINVALFNLIPLPFFDGGQIFAITIERLLGPSYIVIAQIIILIIMLFLVATIRRRSRS